MYHHNKPGQIRAVFDSSAKYLSTSLNDILLRGPDLTNSLLGILLRFRKEQVAIIADIEQMFYCFQVQEHRDYLRFFWRYEDELDNNLVEYRMRVHVFGNSPPAIATYGMRQAAKFGQDTSSIDVENFVERNFYVDDGLCSFKTAEEAIILMKSTNKHCILVETCGCTRLPQIAQRLWMLSQLKTKPVT